MKPEKDTLLKSFYSITFVTGLVWAKSSFGKLESGDFAENLGAILNKSAQNNPYFFYKDFLQTFAIPNSFAFGQMVMWGEILVAISIISSSLYLLFKNSSEKKAKTLLAVGLFGGAFLNINFWLAFSSNNTSADILNLYMIVIELIAGIYLIKELKRD